MRARDKGLATALVTLAAALALMMPAAVSDADGGGDVLFKKSFGGPATDMFLSVIEVPGGFVAVGYSENGSFGSGDWAGEKGGGRFDAIIVKYDHDGNVLWKKRFGGSGDDCYNSVAAVPGGFVAVGYASVFGNGDWTGVAGKGLNDAIAVMYDDDGEALWWKNFGGADRDAFQSVAAVPGGIVAVGESVAKSFGTGDWDGTAGNGGNDAIAVMFDGDGEVMWKRHFGGSGGDYYRSVAAVPGGVVAVGYSDGGSFGNGDWGGTAGNGGSDAIAVMYDGKGE
ncbi:MAG: hypothetical protein FWH47_06610, partial [Methanomassiliicoccaceae archaeon]|nr:hypothetical protein [Methanomassiliicoccaceae archaeon]